jgi:hypothetical protein
MIVKIVLGAVYPYDLWLELQSYKGVFGQSPHYTLNFIWAMAFANQLRQRDNISDIFASLPNFLSNYTRTVLVTLDEELTTVRSL